MILQKIIFCNWIKKIAWTGWRTILSQNVTALQQLKTLNSQSLCIAYIFIRRKVEITRSLVNSIIYMLKQ